MRPHITINAAMSADGKISTHRRKQVRISGNDDFNRVDTIRAHADGVMVGIGTVLADDPSLTVKSGQLRSERKKRCGSEDPARIVVDSMARTPIDADIFKKGEGKRIIAVCENAPKSRVEALQQQGARIITTGEKQVDLAGLMSELKALGIDTLMVEGGATLNWSLLSQGLVDELYTYIGALVLGGQGAPTLVDGIGFADNTDAAGLELVSMEPMDNGVLLRWSVLDKKSG
ncbi:MAG: 2,5-diamino-6-(ribosylamino)-4(3H)-pyrimidinone 5'-phosphate reductase [Methanosarcinales archaeon]|nr:2,5-diamino-6-(ribosylamino)-4(3H)-pyrimidinone 5'-phosphate reductase [ANME-2 cluster archaeon]MDW7775727.1 2,5-diamino-6-(ribosylamino)-4(3H)-pyrimidinone 5'-phosphate reductase [Methanosarcinales archaeon]